LRFLAVRIFLAIYVGFGLLQRRSGDKVPSACSLLSQGHRYAELVEAMRATHRGLQALHAGSTPSLAIQAQAQ